MTIRLGILLAAAAALGLGCIEWVGNCTDATTCVGTANEPWMSLLLAAAIPTAGFFIVLCASRTGYLLWRASRRLVTLETMPAPDVLLAAMMEADVLNVRCLTAAQPMAFCSGALKPRIYVTFGLLQALSRPELQAVLRHEEHHRRRRHPLLRAVLMGAANVMFFLPVMRWLAEHILDEAELAADRAAIRLVGHQAVAAALWRVGTQALVSTPHAIGFGGAAELRAAQLLGDRLPARRPAGRVWFQSLVGIGVALEVALCASSAAVSLIR